MTNRLIPARIDREDVEECVQLLRVRQDAARLYDRQDRVRSLGAGAATLERVLKRDEAEEKVDELLDVVDGEKEAESDG